jgi:hypothetical protein
MRNLLHSLKEGAGSVCHKLVERAKPLAMPVMGITAMGAMAVSFLTGNVSAAGTNDTSNIVAYGLSLFTIIALALTVIFGIATILLKNLYVGVITLIMLVASALLYVYGF